MLYAWKECRRLVNLDDEKAYQQTDPDGMGDLIERFPAQVEKAWRIGREAEVPSAYAAIDNVVIQGMGGSAIGGDLLRALHAGDLKVPVVVVRDYALPGFAGPRILFIASSYSGNTEETLTGYAEAKRRGCKILAMASGGELAALATADKFPLIAIPSLRIQPRAALGYSFFPLLAVLCRLGLVPDASADVRETVGMLQSGVNASGGPGPPIRPSPSRNGSRVITR